MLTVVQSGGLLQCFPGGAWTRGFKDAAELFRDLFCDLRGDLRGGVWGKAAYSGLKFG